MAFDRFKKFIKSAPMENDQAVISDRRTHVESQKNLDYFRRFARHWKLIAATTVALGIGAGAALSWLNTDGAKDLGPRIGAEPIYNDPYQFIERTVLGKQAALDQQRLALVGLDAQGYAWGVYDKRPSIQVDYYHAGDADANSKTDDTCEIDLSLDEKGRPTSLGADGGLFGSNDPKAIELHRNFVMGHEDAHCTFDDEMAPFRGTSLPAATEKVLNDWVVGPGVDRGNSLRKIFNETQADVVGAQVMLKMAGFSAAAWSEVSNDQRDRKDVQKMEETTLTVSRDFHRTYPALQELLEHRVEAQQRSTTDFRDYAYAVASRSLLTQMDATYVRAAPLPNVSLSHLHAEDPLRQGKTVFGALGLNNFDLFLSREGMRATVSEQALQIQEEALGLRVRKAGIENTLPRKMAEAWLAADNPFKPNKDGVAPVIITRKADGSLDRKFAANPQEGTDVFTGPHGGAPAFQTEAAFRAFATSLKLDDVRASLAQVLHATPNVVAKIVQDAPAYPGAQIQSTLPTLKSLGAKIDARQPVQGAVMVPPVVSARKSLTM